MKPAVWVLAVFLAVLAAPRPAHAVPVIYNTGDDIMYLRDIPPDVAKDEPDLAGYKVGWHYSRFGLFWVDFWRWGGELCVYQGNTYEPVPHEAVEALGGDAAPLSYHLPPGLVCVLCGIALWLVGGVFTNKAVRFTIAGVLAAAAIGGHFAGLGFGAILFGGTALVAVLFVFQRPPPEPVSFRSDPDAPPPATP